VGLEEMIEEEEEEEEEMVKYMIIVYLVDLVGYTKMLDCNRTPH